MGLIVDINGNKAIEDPPEVPKEALEESYKEGQIDMLKAVREAVECQDDFSQEELLEDLDKILSML